VSSTWRPTAREASASASARSSRRPSGQADAQDFQADAAADLHDEHRERDRDAELPVEDVVEAAVARIVVVVGVTAEALLVEQELAQPLEGASSILDLRHRRARGELVEPGQRALGDEVGILDSRDPERGAREVDLGTLHQAPEIVERAVEAHRLAQQPGAW